MTESERNQIKALWESGMPIAQIRKMIAVDKATFSVAIKEMKANGEFPNERKTTEQKIIESYQNGIENPYELAEIYGVSYRYVNLLFHKNKVKRPKRNWKHCDKTNAIVEDLKRGELTHAQIAKKHGVNRQWVYQLNKKLQKGVFNI